MISQGVANVAIFVFNFLAIGFLYYAFKIRQNTAKQERELDLKN